MSEVNTVNNIISQIQASQNAQDPVQDIKDMLQQLQSYEEQMGKLFQGQNNKDQVMEISKKIASLIANINQEIAQLPPSQQGQLYNDTSTISFDLGQFVGLYSEGELPTGTPLNSQQLLDFETSSSGDIKSLLNDLPSNKI